MTYQEPFKDRYPTFTFTVKLDDGDTEYVKTGVKELQKRLEKIGGKIYLDKDYLNIAFDEDKFSNKATRNAGRIRKVFSYGFEQYVKYAHIVYWRYGLNMKWDDIAKKMNLCRATFYARKKEILNSYSFSTYMTSIDMSKADDLDYLLSVKGGDTYFY